MEYTKEEVIEFIQQEDVKFIRLAFCDFLGNLKNLAITPEQLDKAFEDGISFDGSAINGFATPDHSDLFLVPIPSSLTVLPWRSTTGKVVRMFCLIRNADGTPFERDSRFILSKAIDKAKDAGLNIKIGSECEFYLFQNDEKGNPTKIPFDHAGYLDVAPADKGENIRREIVLTLKEMDIHPEASHHEEGPGQNQIDIRRAKPMRCADNIINLMSVVRTCAVRNGLTADFSPKPLAGKSGNGFHISVSVSSKDGKYVLPQFLAGVLDHIEEMTAFLNPVYNSYERLGSDKAPKYVGWGKQNRTQLIRVPATKEGEEKVIEIRSPDPCTNPYIAYALIIFAGIDGIERNLPAPDPVELNVYTAPSEITSKLKKLPESLSSAVDKAKTSDFIKKVLPLNMTDFLETSN
ncbi:MAG: glutamine synthetase family protein [Treponema sp.]|nr:glutamine synthetase family protein [Treponema sp.]